MGNIKKKPMRTEGAQRAVAFAAIVFLLFGGYFVFASYLSGNTGLPFVQSISAKDGEDDDNGGDDDDDDDKDDDEDKDDDDDDRSGKDDDDDDDKAAEEAKKRAERAREAAKNQAERESDDDDDDDDFVNGVKVRGDGSVDDDDDDDDRSGRDDEEAMFKDRAKTLEKLNKKIAQAEEKILKKQAEGVDVTAALAQLELAKAGLTTVDEAFTAGELDKIKLLAKQTEKLAHFARGKTLKASEDVAKDIAKVEKRIGQTEGKIALLSGLGGNVESYVASLTDAKADFARAKELIAAGGDSLLPGLALLEATERRVKSIKNAVENALFALGASDDDEFEAEHNEVFHELAEDIFDLAEGDDDSDGRSMKFLLETYEEEAKRVGELMDKLQARSTFMKSLFGNDPAVIAELNAQAAVIEVRIAAMEAKAAGIEDAELRTLVLQKIGELRALNTQLLAFIASEGQTTGLLGWLLPANFPKQQ
jgi:hypothetical protein